MYEGDIELVQRNSHREKLTIKDQDGNRFDLTQYDILFLVKIKETDRDLDSVIWKLSQGLTIDVHRGGADQVYLTSSKNDVILDQINVVFQPSDTDPNAEPVLPPPLGDPGTPPPAPAPQPVLPIGPGYLSYQADAVHQITRARYTIAKGAFYLRATLSTVFP